MSAKIGDLLKARSDNGDGCTFSFEYYPPRTPEGVKNLYARIERMKAMNPLFVDFTWGAGGSTADLTLELTSTAQNKMGCNTNMHLTCTNMEASKVDEALQASIDNNICNIVALRGDPPKGQDKWESTEGGFECALDLVKYISKKHGKHFGVSVAGCVWRCCCCCCGYRCCARRLTPSPPPGTRRATRTTSR